MALTNAMLKAMGIEGDQRDQIMAAHKEVCDSIKAERDELRDTAAKVPDLEKQIEELKANQPTEDFEAKYNDEHEAFEQFKAKVEQDKADQEKSSLYKALLREQGIEEKRLDSILKVTDLSSINVADGALADRDELAEKVKTEWEAFIPVESTKGAEVDNPPSTNSTVDGANPETVKRLQERHARLHGKATETE